MPGNRLNNAAKGAVTPGNYDAFDIELERLVTGLKATGLGIGGNQKELLAGDFAIKLSEPDLRDFLWVVNYCCPTHSESLIALRKVGFRS